MKKKLERAEALRKQNAKKGSKNDRADDNRCANGAQNVGGTVRSKQVAAVYSRNLRLRAERVRQKSVWNMDFSPESDLIRQMTNNVTVLTHLSNKMFA